MPDAAPVWNSLSRTTAQVLICDLQKQLVPRSGTTGPEALARSAGVLLGLARHFELPTLLSVVPEEGESPELIPELVAELDDEAGDVGGEHGFAQRLTRTTVGPFLDPATIAAVAANDRKLLVVAGFAIEAVVLHAVIDARTHGYEVIVPVDACGGMSAATEAAALRQIEAAGAVTSSVVSIATKLGPDFTEDERLFELVQRLRLS